MSVSNYPPTVRDPFEIFSNSSDLKKIVKMAMAAKGNVLIREVWDHNVEKEMELIRAVAKEFRYVAIDTEFPGTGVVKVFGNFSSRREYDYMSMMGDINVLSLIQLGLTFADENGNLPDCGTGQPCAWQFNFREFDPDHNLHAPDAIELLKKSGIDFKKNNEMGIDATRFAELLWSSGIFCNPKVHWISFHGCYDFGYLIKLVHWWPLLPTTDHYFGLVRFYFPNVYDVKHLIKYCDGLYGGLSKVAELLKVDRVGTSHQAGYDSLLTCRVFMKLAEMYPPTYINRFANVVYGLG